MGAGEDGREPHLWRRSAGGWPFGGEWGGRANRTLPKCPGPRTCQLFSSGNAFKFQLAEPECGIWKGSIVGWLRLKGWGGGDARCKPFRSYANHSGHFAACPPRITRPSFRNPGRGNAQPAQAQSLGGCVRVKLTYAHVGTTSQETEERSAGAPDAEAIPGASLTHPAGSDPFFTIPSIC
jgi:hypothetical protein